MRPLLLKNNPLGGGQGFLARPDLVFMLNGGRSKFMMIRLMNLNYDQSFIKQPWDATDVHVLRKVGVVVTNAAEAQVFKNSHEECVDTLPGSSSS